MAIRKSHIILTLPLVLAACSGMQLSKAEKVEPQGTLFQVSLYEGYLERARDEYAESDYVDSDNFANRAITAGSGQNVAPEGINARDLPAAARPQLVDARRRLQALQGQGAINYIPALMARAQVAFDCWMQEQEENFQPADIAACRSQFFGALISAEEFMARRNRPAQVAEAEPEPAPAPAPAPAMPAPVEVTVYFETGSAALTPANAATVRRAANMAKQRNATSILVVGHTDRAGDIRSNIRLSERRAETVTRALIAEGVRASAITTESYGEAQPVQPTQDGVPLVFNRRVVISF